MYTEVPNKENPSDSEVHQALSTAYAEGALIDAKSIDGNNIDKYLKKTDIASLITILNNSESWRYGFSGEITIFNTDTSICSRIRPISKYDKELLKDPYTILGVSFFDSLGNNLGWWSSSIFPDGEEIRITPPFISPNTEYSINVYLFNFSTRTIAKYGYRIKTPSSLIYIGKPILTFFSGRHNLPTYFGFKITNIDVNLAKKVRITIKEEDTNKIVYDKTRTTDARKWHIEPGILKRGTRYSLLASVSDGDDVWQCGHNTRITTTGVEHKIRTTIRPSQYAEIPLYGYGNRAISLGDYVLVFPEKITNSTAPNVMLDNPDKVYVYDKSRGYVSSELVVPVNGHIFSTANFVSVDANTVMLVPGKTASNQMLSTGHICLITHTGNGVFTITDTGQSPPLHNSILTRTSTEIYMYGRPTGGTDYRYERRRWDGSTFVADAGEWKTSNGVLKNHRAVPFHGNSYLVFADYQSFEARSSSTRVYKLDAFGGEIVRLPDSEIPLTGFAVASTGDGRILIYGSGRTNYDYYYTGYEKQMQSSAAILAEYDYTTGKVTVIREFNTNAYQPFMCETGYGSIFITGGRIPNRRYGTNDNYCNRASQDVYYLELS